MELNILVRLLIAHLLTDFVWQPASWVSDKERKKERSVKLYLHVFLAAVLTYLLLGSWHNWWIPLIILVTHLFIDIWKLHRPNTNFYFLVDQLFHLIVILAIWLSVYVSRAEFINMADELINNDHIWILRLHYGDMAAWHRYR